MPIYEYRCQNCGKRSSFLQSISDTSLPTCPHCRSQKMRRLISRVAVLRSEESQLERLAEPGQFADVDENDPQSVARWMRKMGREVGEDLGPEFSEMVDRLEAGESAEEIEGSTASEEVPGS